MEESPVSNRVSLSCWFRSRPIFFLRQPVIYIHFQFYPERTRTYIPTNPGQSINLHVCSEWDGGGGGGGDGAGNAATTSGTKKKMMEEEEKKKKMRKKNPWKID